MGPVVCPSDRSSSSTDHSRGTQVPPGESQWHEVCRLRCQLCPPAASRELDQAVSGRGQSARLRHPGTLELGPDQPTGVVAAVV